MSRHSEVMKRRWNDPVERTKIVKAMSEAAKARWADSKKRERLLAVRRATTKAKPYIPPQYILNDLAELGLTYQQFRALPEKRRHRVLRRVRMARETPSRRDEHFAIAREWADASKPEPLNERIAYKNGPKRKPRERWCTPTVAKVLSKHGVEKATYLALPPQLRSRLVYRLRALDLSPYLRDTHIAVINEILREPVRR